MIYTKLLVLRWRHANRYMYDIRVNKLDGACGFVDLNIGRQSQWMLIVLHQFLHVLRQCDWGIAIIGELHFQPCDVWPSHERKSSRSFPKDLESRHKELGLPRCGHVRAEISQQDSLNSAVLLPTKLQPLTMFCILVGNVNHVRKCIHFLKRRWAVGFYSPNLTD